MKRVFAMNVVLLLILFLVFHSNIKADDWVKVVDLEGRWKFNIGDDSAWADYDFNDDNWEEIKVPSSWENEGYFNYNGYAWYRTYFDLPRNLDKSVLYISLGHIDDVDEIYLNGKLVGSTGSFPPNYQTAYSANRKYPVAWEYFNKGEPNVLAVKVYDSRLSGGILSGDIAVMMFETLEFEENLEGFWKFKIGDDISWSNPEFDDTDWEQILVPSKWAISGYEDYNGFAWYRKSIEVDPTLEDEMLVLMLGKIDDLDQCYVNGQLVGSTGDFDKTPKDNYFNNEYQELRGYYIPKGVLDFNNGVNVIAVRVYDGYLDGGIYQGPIGITTQDEYRDYWKDKKRKRSFWDYIFD